MTAALLAAGYAGLFALVLGIGGRSGGFVWELASLFVIVGYPLATMVAAAHALVDWTRGRVLAALPVLLLLGGVVAVGGVRATDDLLQDRRFTRHLEEIEAILIRAPIDSGRRIRLPADSLPAEIRRCCVRAVFIRRDQEGQLSATLIGPRRTAYLYDPTGARLAHGQDVGRWRSHYRVAPEWYRVIRF